MIVLPMISVIMPVYNGEKYLQESINSILNQTYKYFEFIILNDGSSDKTEEIILSYNDPRIVYVKNETNLEIVKTLNKGISLAKGKYIARMDADDISLPKRFEVQLNFLENNSSISICGSWIETFGYQKKLWKSPISHDEIKARLLLNSSIFHPTVMIKKAVFHQFLYEQEYKKAEDYALWVKAIDSFKFHNIPEVLLRYRIHNNQTNVIEQRVIAKEIRTIMLNKIDCHLNSQEFNLLNKISHCDELFPTDLKATNFLIKKILQANALRNYFASHALYSILQASMCCPLKKSVFNKVSLSLNKFYMMLLIFWYCLRRIVKV